MKFILHEPAFVSTPNWSLEPSARRNRKLHPLPVSARAAAAASSPSSAVLVRLTTSEMTPRNNSNLNLKWRIEEASLHISCFLAALFSFFLHFGIALYFLKYSLVFATQLILLLLTSFSGSPLSFH